MKIEVWDEVEWNSAYTNRVERGKVALKRGMVLILEWDKGWDGHKTQEVELPYHKKYWRIYTSDVICVYPSKNRLILKRLGYV